MKLWYLSNFFRYERPQAGRFRQFWQIGAEAIGSADPAVDAELILLLGEILEAIGAREVKLVIATLGQPESRAAYREELQAYLRAQRGPAQPRGHRADRPQPAARLRRQARADAARDGQRAAADRPPAAGGPRPLRRGPGPAAARPTSAYTVDTTLVRGLDYYTRTLFEFQSGALEAAQNTLGGGGRYDGLAEADRRPADARHGLGGRGRADADGLARSRRRAEPPVDLYVAYEPGHKAAAFRLAADARRAGHSARLELAGRSLKGQLKQASRSRARYVAIFGDDGVQLRDREGGEDKVVAPETVMHHIRGRL